MRKPIGEGRIIGVVEGLFQVTRGDAVYYVRAANAEGARGPGQRVWLTEDENGEIRCRPLDE